MCTAARELRSTSLADCCEAAVLKRAAAGRCGAGNLVRLRYLDLYNNRMHGDVPPGIQNLTNLKELYLQNEHLKPVRQYYCRQRIPNVGKYSWRMVREEYREMMAIECDDMHDTEFTFNALQHSSSYDATS